jgi:hypothetical protein
MISNKYCTTTFTKINDKNYQVLVVQDSGYPLPFIIKEKYVDKLAILLPPEAPKLARKYSTSIRDDISNYLFLNKNKFFGSEWEFSDFNNKYYLNSLTSNKFKNFFSPQEISNIVDVFLRAIKMSYLM